MTRAELKLVKRVLENIKPREHQTELPGKVQLAISYINKDLAVREAQRDNFKDMYEPIDEGRW